MSRATETRPREAKKPTGTAKRRARSSAAPSKTVAGGKRAMNKAQNRAQILDAARDVFAELGYGAATVRDIIRRTDLASGTFYNYFQDKDAIFRALLEENTARIMRALRRVPSESINSEEMLLERFRLYFAAIAEDEAMFALWRRNVGTLRAFGQEPFVIAAVQENLEALQAAIERKELPPLNVEYFAKAIFGASFEIAVLMVEREPIDVEGAASFMTALFLGTAQRARKMR